MFNVNLKVLTAEHLMKKRRQVELISTRGYIWSGSWNFSWAPHVKLFWFCTVTSRTAWFVNNGSEISHPLHIKVSINLVHTVTFGFWYYRAVMLFLQEMVSLPRLYGLLMVLRTYWEWLKTLSLCELKSLTTIICDSRFLWILCFFYWPLSYPICKCKCIEYHLSKQLLVPQIPCLQ